MSRQIRPEIDNHTTKLVVGLVAVLLAVLTSLFSVNELPSISASYWQPEHWPRNIFVGFLFAIGAFLLSYNGKQEEEEKWPTQMILSKVAAIAAFCVALFPCSCDCAEPPSSCAGTALPEVVGKIHYGAAAVMFGVLAVFCYFFYRAARLKEWSEARLRVKIYAICGGTIIGAMALMFFDGFSGGFFSNRFDAFTFWAEAAGLMAFGTAWLTASHKLPVINSSEERVPFFKEREGNNL